MADFSQTITNSLNLFGIAPSNKWNAYAWNAFKWGEGTADLGVHVVHLISESLSADTSWGFGVTKLIASEITPTADMSSERLFDASGYYYVFPDRTSEGEERDIPTWTAGAAGSTSWSTATVTTTTWS